MPLPVLLDLGEEVEFAGGGEEAGFDGVGGEFAELVEGEAEVGVGEGVLVEQGGAEHGWVVGVDGDHEAEVEVGAQGVVVQRGAAAGAQVGGDVDLDGDLALGEDLHEFGVVVGGEGVADALCPDVDGGPDAGGTFDDAAGFASVGGEAQTGGASLGVKVFEEGSGTSRFVSPDADADDGGILLAEFGGLAEDSGGLFGAEVAYGVDEPVEGGTSLLLAADSATLDGFDEGFDFRVLPVIEDADGDVDLGVDDALGGEGADHVVGDELVVCGRTEAGCDGLEGGKEAEEVVVGVEAAGVIEGEWRGVVAAGELDQGLRLDGAFEVKMELDLGEIAQPGCEVELGGGRLLAGHSIRLVEIGARCGEKSATLDQSDDRPDCELFTVDSLDIRGDMIDADS